MLFISQLLRYVALGPRVEGRARKEDFLASVNAQLIHESFEQNGARRDLIHFEDLRRVRDFFLRLWPVFGGDALDGVQVRIE